MGNDLPTFRNGNGFALGVLYAQGMLFDLGYFTDRDDIDGWFGTRTEKAIKTLQGDDGLPVTGVLDNSTWTDLISRWWVLK